MVEIQCKIHKVMIINHQILLMIKSNIVFQKVQWASMNRMVKLYLSKWWKTWEIMMRSSNKVQPHRCSGTDEIRWDNACVIATSKRYESPVSCDYDETHWTEQGKYPRTYKSYVVEVNLGTKVTLWDFFLFFYLVGYPHNGEDLHVYKEIWGLYSRSLFLPSHSFTYNTPSMSVK